MRRKFKKKALFLKLFALLGCIALFVFLIFKVEVFNVDKIEIVSKDLECVRNEQVKDSLQIEGKNIFTVNNSEIVKNIKEKFICVKNVAIKPVYPKKISLELFPRQPAARVLALETEESTSSASLETIATPSAQIPQESYLIDEEGVLYAKTSDLFNPAVFIHKTDLSLGKEMKEDFRNSLKILDKLKIFKVSVSSSLIYDDFFVVYSLPRIIFRLDSKTDTQIASLQLILEKAKIDSEELEFIDLRFDKPIVRFAPKKK